jgi:hypothetical protein
MSTVFDAISIVSDKPREFRMGKLARRTPRTCSSSLGIARERKRKKLNPMFLGPPSKYGPALEGWELPDLKAS